ncbi:MAG: restriction endonuclease subunit S [Gammaproteobacteria bacterium]|nr:restriction endonuclease subunit S [Gammaproteobacteria bacterium]MCP5458285.1 restriction endonuclease subunit S [Gammaproteobacteria bacterium]
MTNEVKPGYKLTEVGVIPEDWDVVQLGDLRPFITSGSRGWASFYSDRGSLFVRITNLSRESIYLDLTDSKFVNLPPGSSEGVRTQLKEHDILISITADIGIIGYVDVKVPCPAYINQHIALVRFDASQACGKFVSYFLASEKPQRLFRASMDVGAKAGMNLITVQKIQTALPPLPEQRAIAAALSDVDALLDGLDRLIAKKRDLKQAAMQQLLTGQTRLPGFSGAWEVRRLRDHLTFLKNGVNSRAELTTDGQVKYLHYGDIHGTKRLFLDPNETQMPHISTSKVSKLDRLSDGDLVFADASEDLDGVGKSVELKGTKQLEIVSGLHTIAIRFDKQVLVDGFKAYLQFVPVFRQHLRQLASGTKVYATNRAHIASVTVSLPTVKEQTAIAAILSDMDAEIAALEARRDKTRALKQGMMQELLTGRIRLIDPSLSNQSTGEADASKATDS